MEIDSYVMIANYSKANMLAIYQAIKGVLPSPSPRQPLIVLCTCSRPTLLADTDLVRLMVRGIMKFKPHISGLWFGKHATEIFNSQGPSGTS